MHSQLEENEWQRQGHTVECLTETSGLLDLQRHEIGVFECHGDSKHHPVPDVAVAEQLGRSGITCHPLDSQLSSRAYLGPLSAPFSHRHWSSIFHTGILLASTLDSFARAEVSFVVFLLLYLAGSWAAWFARTVLVRGFVQEDSFAYYTQECGASGGLAAQLMFLAKIRPEEMFSFSIYMIPTPLVLRAWQSCLAHGILDIFQSSGRGAVRQFCAHCAAWALGWLLATAWQKHE